MCKTPFSVCKSTLPNKFYYHACLLFKNLLNRSYKPVQIKSLIRYFANVDRKLNYDCNSILFITYFGKNLPNFTNFVNEVWNSTKANNSTLKNFKLKIVPKKK